MSEAALRVIDANRNRALEALRTVEEYARFVRQAPALAGRCKALRHDLQRALDVPALAGAIAARDVAGDPGHPAVAPDTRAREGLEDVVRANLSRAKEACRALEEFAKPLAPAAAAAVSQVRYAVYELEQALLTPVPSLEDRGVYVLLGNAPGRPAVIEQAEACLEGGVRLFQLREKALSDRALLALARDLVLRLRPAGAPLVINDRPEIARLADADGVHLGRDDLPAREARRVLGAGRLVGASVHSVAELEAALTEGPDYVGVGTLFPSRTKPELGARGLDVLREVAPRCPLPLYGIGGVDAGNAAQAIAAGADGVAVGSAVLDAADPTAAARELVKVVTAARAARLETPA